MILCSLSLFVVLFNHSFFLPTSLYWSLHFWILFQCMLTTLKRAHNTPQVAHSHLFSVQIPNAKTSRYSLSYMLTTNEVWNILLSLIFSSSYYLPSLKHKVPRHLKHAINWTWFTSFEQWCRISYIFISCFWTSLTSFFNRWGNWLRFLPFFLSFLHIVKKKIRVQTNLGLRY